MLEDAAIAVFKTMLEELSAKRDNANDIKHLNAQLNKVIKLYKKKVVALESELTEYKQRYGELNEN